MPLPFTTRHRLGPALGVLIFLCAIITGRAERAYTTVGSTISENFDALASTGSANGMTTEIWKSPPLISSHARNFLRVSTAPK